MTALIVMTAVLVSLVPYGRPARRLDELRGIGPIRPRLFRRRTRVDRAVLPLLLELIARELRSGSTVPVALHTVAANEPAADSLVPVVHRVAHGARVGDELDAWAARFDSDDARLARSVLRLGLSTGAALADALDRVAATVRDRIELDDELRALTAQSRTSATVLAMAPAVFLGVLALVDRGLVAPLIATPFGWLCLAGGLGLDAIGFWWMRRLVAGVDR
ncbi:MAG: type II secretion system F family protein [Actinomycetota bacterium]